MPLPSAAAGQSCRSRRPRSGSPCRLAPGFQGLAFIFHRAIVTIWIAFSVATWTWLGRKEVSAKSIALAALSK